MYFTTLKTDKQGQHLKRWEATQFYERIKTDANNFLIGFLRDEAPAEQPQRYRRYKEIPLVYAAVELCKQTNGAYGMAAFNGLVVLEVRQLMSAKACDETKRAAMTMPSTLATFTGATGTEVIILVSVAQGGGTLPATEPEAELFYAQAYQRVAHIYDAVLPVHVTRMTPSLRHTFLLPLDTQPLVSEHAVPLRITGSEPVAAGDDADQHLLALPEQRTTEEVDMTAYLNYERAYDEAVQQVEALMRGVKYGTAAWFQQYVTGMATTLFGMGWGQEETVCHLWNHLKFKDADGLTEDFVRRIVEPVYDEELAARKRQPPLAVSEPLMQSIIRRMENRYVFRRNTVMGYTEYRPNHTWATPWAPVTEEVVNTFTTDLQLSGLGVWDRDVKRYINSTRIRNYDPADDYLCKVSGRWDKKHDYIRALAATVPTDNAAQWADWFHTWFLAMVAQWQGRDRRYGNAIVPLLISEQGQHKSSFCRQLLPPELRVWGYTDNLSLAEERPVHLAMAQMLLINLDEFNRISPQKQQGFLKNILQLPTVKVKRPYGRHTEEVPRLASFIATTNMADVLTDPSGSRRFLGVQVTGSIDVSQTPNYEQLYAQAQTELHEGARYWFDDAETAAIMEHNRQFQQQSSAEMFFHQYFSIPASEAEEGQWMMTSEILQIIKKHAGAAFQVPPVNAFGRALCGNPDILRRRSKKGSEFYVKST